MKKEDKMVFTAEMMRNYHLARVESFNGLSAAQIKTSTRSHKGQMTKLGNQALIQIDTCRAFPNKRCADALEETMDRIKEKLADIEYGYNELSKEDGTTEPDNIKKVEKICNDTNDMMDRILRTLAQVKQPEEPSAAAPAGTPQQNGVKIKDGLKPEKLKMDNNPSEFRRWKVKIHTFFTASNLIKATNLEQRGYLEMCIDTELGERLEANPLIHQASPVLRYTGEPEPQDLTCIQALERDFINRYPMTSRRHELLQAKQARGELMSTYSAKINGLIEDSDIMNCGIEELVATILICGCTNDELKEELMKLVKPTRADANRAIDNYEQRKSDMKRTSEAKAYVAKSDKGKKKEVEKKEPTCWLCGNNGHRSTECRKKKEDLYCKKCKRKGHVTKICSQHQKLGRARQTRDVPESEDSDDDRQSEHVKAARSDPGTPPMLL